MFPIFACNVTLAEQIECIYHLTDLFVSHFVPANGQKYTPVENMYPIIPIRYIYYNFGEKVITLTQVFQSVDRPTRVPM